MSRIGEKQILIPDGVTVKMQNGVFEVKGPKGELSRSFSDEVGITVEGREIKRRVNKNTNQARKLWGTYSAHILNMIEGVTRGFEKKLQIEGVGYRVSLEGNNLVINAGFSHPVVIKPPEGIKYEVEKNIITVSGIDKEKVGNDAARIRAVKKPEPYKGKGIRYKDEVIRRKAGKKMVGAVV